MREREREGRGDRGDRESQGIGPVRKKSCRFCVDKNLKIDYKDINTLRSFVSEWGRIVPMRISGACAFHQRQVKTAVKRSRILALLPFTAFQQQAMS